MAGLFASGAMVDLILALVAGEALLLVLLRRRLGFPGGAGAILANLAAGAALLLALRAALVGAPWPVLAGWLLVGLCAHLADLGARLRTTRADAARGRFDAAPAGRVPELRSGRDVPAQ